MPKYNKRKDGRYEKKIKLGTNDAGKVVYKTIYARTSVELEQKAAMILSAVSSGTYADDQKLTVLQWANHWLDTYKKDKSFSTVSGYENIIKNHIKSIHGIRLRDLHKSDVQQCINNASGHYDIQRRIKNTLNQMLEVAIDDGLVSKNVCRGVTLPRKPKAETRALTPKERSVLPTIDFSAEEKCFIWILWYAGLRPEEARALTVNDVDLHRKTITINKAVSFTQNQPVLSPPKTDAGFRTIDILSPLFPVLSDYLSSLDNLYLFSNSSGNLHTRTTYRRFWDKCFDKINIAMGGTCDRTEKGSIINGIHATDLTPYVFRHEYATILYYSGIDIKEAARLMGHADIKMILEIYAELDSKKSSATSKLEAFLASDY